MNGVVGGFVALTAVIAVGWLVARTGTLGRDAAAVLSRLSYVVATPALLLLTLAGADPAGRPVVLEVELTEPNLFLPHAPAKALSRLARAVGDAIAA